MGNLPTPLLFQGAMLLASWHWIVWWATCSEKSKMQAAEAGDVKTLNPFCNSHSMNLSRTFRAMDLRCPTSGRLHDPIVSVKKYMGHF
jgi:hypothetical protein